jgi:hypothetical protein
LAVSNGYVYAWGNDNSYGQLGWAGGATGNPTLVAGISNVVLVSANPNGYHSLAMTVDGGTNRYWGWGDNYYGEVGNGTNYTNSGGSNDQSTPAGPVQFCTRCQRCVQLGTGGVFAAQCNGTLYLYFNAQQGQFGSNGTNFYTVTFPSLTNGNIVVMGANYSGVPVGTVTNGGTYSYTATGFCQRDVYGDLADPNGNAPSGGQIGCSSIDVTNAICPACRCFSLVGKIQ